MYLSGEEVYVEMGAIEGQMRRIKWRKGVIVRRYNGWYLINFGKFLSGASEIDIRRELKEDGK